MIEIWEYIKGFEGNYMISSFGRVSSYRRILKLRYRGGRPKITINYKGKSYGFSISRLVAQAFLGLDIGNPKLFVCHIDDNPKNNNVSNLFIGTHKDNMADMLRKGRKFLTFKKINQYTKDGIFIKKWDSIKSASTFMCSHRCSIARCLSGITKTSGGFIWRYADSDNLSLK